MLDPAKSLRDSIRHALGPKSAGILDHLSLLTIMTIFRHPGTAEAHACEQLRRWGEAHLHKMDHEEVQHILVTLRCMTGSDAALTALLRAWSGLRMRDGTQVKDALP